MEAYFLLEALDDRIFCSTVQPGLLARKFGKNSFNQKVKISSLNIRSFDWKSEVVASFHDIKNSMYLQSAFKVGHIRIQDFLYFKFCLFHDSDFILYSIHFVFQILFCDMLYINRQYLKWKNNTFFWPEEWQKFWCLYYFDVLCTKRRLWFFLYLFFFFFWESFGFFSSLNWVWV